MVLAAFATILFAGCTAPRPPLVVTDPDPSVKIPAFKKAVRKKDRGAVRQLVKDLDSDDPAVRFYAIGALERMTGQQLGYRYYDDETGRSPAIARWQNWLDGREAVADSTPGSRGADGTSDGTSD
ncbi:MAG TPA: HEAT repeat domain-containing protein [Tepidisphaeraceae bacterium]|nr:HEAT repeat domain-containing protein [Tepidisphaeraceae bacterium]